VASVIETLERLQDEIVDRAVDRLRRDVSLYGQLPLPEVTRRIREALDPILRDVREGKMEYYSEYLRNLSYERSRQGVPLEVVQQAVRVSNIEIITTLREKLDANNATLVDAVDQIHRITETGIIGLYAGYEQAQQEIIESQQSAIQELSTPIIPMYEGILVLPIVGSIDSHRAGQIMEGLLEGISAHTADVVILDITGVPVIDTGVANYLLQSARAARLLGSTVVLVGIGAEIAQTVVQLGIDMAGIVTRANLQSGIEFALAAQGLAIQPLVTA
jgi:rsbT co-antagonist protein RsbR